MGQLIFNMQKMSNLETKGVVVKERELVYKCGLKHRFDCTCLKLHMCNRQRDG